jgi:dTDP-4-dehydrorhamnose reductase
VSARLGARGVRRRALVTGAAGFIGSHLCERLLAEGWRVVGVDCFTDHYPRADKHANLAALRNEPSFELLEADLGGDGWQAALRAQDTVFHLAAQAGVRGSFGSSFGRYARDNLVATQRVFEAASRAGARRVVWASSSSVYGDAATYPCNERTTAPRPRSPYGVTKRACEDLAQVYRGGLPITGLRYLTVFGPRQRPDMALRRICDALVRRRPFTVYGDGFQSRDFTYVSDACDAPPTAQRWWPPRRRSTTSAAARRPPWPGSSACWSGCSACRWSCGGSPRNAATSGAPPPTSCWLAVRSAGRPRSPCCTACQPGSCPASPGSTWSACAGRPR